ncbi:hypothetical protein EJ05DRAFT_64644 [Pseudovirgaria hyperparasitica]|uniref:MARVEL domain-containing protein n=1 Tax=Pseudovirgaria hyperparasitica TaxID=470096 RepID=A0A6A6W3B5_9PEZI|nr:uncharacterized protein EJ05DRAFT_64644 [Pseudovirgaria hyperparasitica]KAF2756420.1 hypothetical protein EJ05DRAFT_64644 [Pseudovirgaria hyperparasitica]
MDGQDRVATPAEETTPLLTNNNTDVAQAQDADNNDPSQDVEAGMPAANGQPRTPRSIIVMTALIMPLAVLEIATYIAGIPLGQTVPWWATYQVQPLITLTILASVAAIINIVLIRRRGTPLAFPLNLIIDIALGLSIWSSVAPVLDHILGRYPETSEILLILTFVFGFIIALLFFALFIVRCIAFIRDQRRQSTWSVPTGGVTFEFSIKFFRQENTGTPAP